MSSGESPFPFSKRKQKFLSKGFAYSFGIPKEAMDKRSGCLKKSVLKCILVIVY